MSNIIMVYNVENFLRHTASVTYRATKEGNSANTDFCKRNVTFMVVRATQLTIKVARRRSWAKGE